MPDKENIWSTIKEIFNYWVDDGEIELQDIDNLDSIDWFGIDEDYLIQKLTLDSLNLRIFQRFLKALGEQSIEQHRRNLATLVMRLYALVLIMPKPDDPSSQIDEVFWRLLEYSTFSEWVNFDQKSRLITIGSQKNLSFFESLIPNQYLNAIVGRLDKDYYKNTLQDKSTYKEKLPKVSSTQEVIDEDSVSTNLKRMLDGCSPGTTDFPIFEKIGVEALQYLFSDNLGKPAIQSRIWNNLQRRDAIFPNIGFGSRGTFWHQIYDKYDAQQIVIEFKNFNDVGQSALDQVVKYCTTGAFGKFGLIWNRMGEKSNFQEARRMAYATHQVAVLILFDDDILEMVRMKEQGKHPEDHLQGYLWEFQRNFHK